MASEKRLIDANALLVANMYGNTAPIIHRTYAENLIKNAPAAHPQMREVAKLLLKQMREMVPGVFDDCGEV